MTKIKNIENNRNKVDPIELENLNVGHENYDKFTTAMQTFMANMKLYDTMSEYIMNAQFLASPFLSANHFAIYRRLPRN